MQLQELVTFLVVWALNKLYITLVALSAIISLYNTIFMLQFYTSLCQFLFSDAPMLVALFPFYPRRSFFTGELHYFLGQFSRTIIVSKLIPRALYLCHQVTAVYPFMQVHMSHMIIYEHTTSSLSRVENHSLLIDWSMQKALLRKQHTARFRFSDFRTITTPWIKTSQLSRSFPSTNLEKWHLCGERIQNALMISDFGAPRQERAALLL